MSSSSNGGCNRGSERVRRTCRARRAGAALPRAFEGASLVFAEEQCHNECKVAGTNLCKTCLSHVGQRNLWHGYRNGPIPGPNQGVHSRIVGSPFAIAREATERARIAAKVAEASEKAAKAAAKEAKAAEKAAKAAAKARSNAGGGGGGGPALWLPPATSSETRRARAAAASPGLVLRNVTRRKGGLTQVHPSVRGGLTHRLHGMTRKKYEGWKH